MKLDGELVMVVMLELGMNYDESIRVIVVVMELNIDGELVMVVMVVGVQLGKRHGGHNRVVMALDGELWWWWCREFNVAFINPLAIFHYHFHTLFCLHYFHNTVVVLAITSCSTRSVNFTTDLLT